MTEGLLLRLLSSSSEQVMNDRKVIILDEIHERHISCDFLLGLIKCLVAQNNDLRVVLMSATANLQLFSNYFDNCPIIEVSTFLDHWSKRYTVGSYECRATVHIHSNVKSIESLWRASASNDEFLVINISEDEKPSP